MQVHLIVAPCPSRGVQLRALPATLRHAERTVRATVGARILQLLWELGRLRHPPMLLLLSTQGSLHVLQASMALPNSTPAQCFMGTPVSQGPQHMPLPPCLRSPGRAEQVYIAPCDAEALLADVHGQQEPAAKALVDDVYLGYVPLSQLSACLQHFRALADPLVLAMRNSRWMCALVWLGSSADVRVGFGARDVSCVQSTTGKTGPNARQSVALNPKP